MRRRCLTILFALAVCGTSSAVAQRQATSPGTSPAASTQTVSELPDGPVPQDELAVVGEPWSQQPEPNASAQNGATADEKREQAREQIKEQKGQRVLWIIPAFNTTYRNDAVPLTAPEKMGLAFRSAIDPMAFGTAFIVAGASEAFGGNAGFGWGPGGYFKRTGAAYLDSFNGRMFGKGILPSMLHQDPRYFRLGHGSAWWRSLYAAGSVVICKHDSPRRWEPNYSNVGGNITAGVFSQLYYPGRESGASETFVNAMVITAEGAFGAMFQEFWPDISRKWFHKDPTRGLDDAARAADEAKHPPEPKK
jgi:hypothetical protein